MFAPQYLVTSTGIAKRPASGDLYGQQSSNALSYRVSLMHGQYAGQKISLYFPTQEQADQFGQWEIYSPQQIMDRLGSKESTFTVQGISQTKQIGPPNPFTDRPEIQDAWKAALMNPTDDRAMEWLFQTETQARTQFGAKQSYTVQDMFGTMVSVPQVVADSFAYAAEQAVARAAAKELAKHKLAVAKEKQAEANLKAAIADVANKLAAEKTYQNTASQARNNAQQLQATVAADLAAQQIAIKNGADPAEMQSLIRQYQQDKDAADQAATTAQLAANDVKLSEQSLTKAQIAADAAASAVKAAAAHLDQRTIPTDIQTYTITDGGATGLYNGVYYAAGTFHPSQGTFQWNGIFEPK